MSDLVAILAKRSVAELVEWGKEALDRAGSFDEVRKVKATASALEAYQRSVKAGEEAIAAAREVKLRADRRLGEELAKVEKAKAGRPKKIGGEFPPISGTPTLAELGVDKDEAKAARALAAATREQFEAGIEALRDAGELTEDAMKKLMREAVAGGMGEEEIKASVAAVKARREAKRTPEDRERLAAEDDAVTAIGLLSSDAWKLDPETCARGTEWFLRAGRVVKARACREWLDTFITELERLNDEAVGSQAA